MSLPPHFDIGFTRTDTDNGSRLVCPCGDYFEWVGDAEPHLETWWRKHVEHVWPGSRAIFQTMSEFQTKAEFFRSAYESAFAREGRLRTMLRIPNAEATDDAVERITKDSCKLTHKQLEAACKNIGYDLTCGLCACVFFTGSADRVGGHDVGCTTKHQDVLVWEDKSLPEDAEIRAAFPTRTNNHEPYGEAMRLVSASHSKGKLVALVNWLLVRIKKLEEEKRGDL